MLIGAPKLLAKGTSMKLRSIALVLAVTLASAAAYAQTGLYVTMDSQQFTQVGVNVIPTAGSANTDKPWLFGPAYGIYYDVTRLPHILVLPGGPLKTGPVLIGIDGRGDTLRLSLYHETFNRQDGIVDLRISTKKAFKGTTPYIMGGFGIGHTKVYGRTYYSNNLVYQFGLGADHKIAKHIDWRVVEATAGFLQGYNTGYSASGLGPGQSNYLVTLGTGLVFLKR
jgi:hypothetical protein